MEEKHEERSKNGWKTENMSGFRSYIKIKPQLTEQPRVSECACISVHLSMHVFMHVHVCVVTCISPPHLLPLLHNLQATAPHLTPPCPAPQGLSQKKKG